jgi:hypothetical protein
MELHYVHKDEPGLDYLMEVPWTIAAEEVEMSPVLSR